MQAYVELGFEPRICPKCIGRASGNQEMEVEMPRRHVFQLAVGTFQIREQESLSGAVPVRSETLE